MHSYCVAEDQHMQQSLQLASVEAMAKTVQKQKDDNLLRSCMAATS